MGDKLECLLEGASHSGTGALNVGWRKGDRESFRALSASCVLSSIAARRQQDLATRERTGSIVSASLVNFRVATWLVLGAVCHQVPFMREMASEEDAFIGINQTARLPGEAPFAWETYGTRGRIFRYDRRAPNLCRAHRPDAGKALCQTTQIAPLEEWGGSLPTHSGRSDPRWLRERLCSLKPSRPRQESLAAK